MLRCGLGTYKKELKKERKIGMEYKHIATFILPKFLGKESIVTSPKQPEPKKN